MQPSHHLRPHTTTPRHLSEPGAELHLSSFNLLLLLDLPHLRPLKSSHLNPEKTIPTCFAQSSPRPRSSVPSGQHSPAPHASCPKVPLARPRRRAAEGTFPPKLPCWKLSLRIAADFNVLYSDAFQKREQASENYAIRQREKEKLLELKKKVAEQREHLDRLSEHMYVYLHSLPYHMPSIVDREADYWRPIAMTSPRTKAARRTRVQL